MITFNLNVQMVFLETVKFNELAYDLFSFLLTFIIILEKLTFLSRNKYSKLQTKEKYNFSSCCKNEN